ncbi:MAG TPA: sulfur carrier protein ThiS [Micromonospora sp.]
MQLTVNGVQQTVESGATVADVVAGVTEAERGVAVAVNGEVVPRGRWSSVVLRPGDRVEVLTAAQGG